MFIKYVKRRKLIHGCKQNILSTLRTSALWFPKASNKAGRKEGNWAISSSWERRPTSWKSV